MNGLVSSRVAWVAGAALAVGSCTLPSQAAALEADDQCTREDAQSADPAATAAGDARADVNPSSAAIEAETVRPLPAVTVTGSSLPNPRHAAWWPAHFADHVDIVERLRSLRRLRLLRLWDNARITVFIGVDRAGVAGVHFQQQDPHDQTWLTLRAAPVDLPPLRAVPLRSP